jgi:hypothetical protein
MFIRLLPMQILNDAGQSRWCGSGVHGWTKGGPLGGTVESGDDLKYKEDASHVSRPRAAIGLVTRSTEPDRTLTKLLCCHLHPATILMWHFGKYSIRRYLDVIAVIMESEDALALPEAKQSCSAR